MAESGSTFEVNGHTLTVDAEARDSWEVFDLMCEVGPDMSVFDMPVAFRIVEACTGVGKDAFVEMCGGKRVHRDVVLGHLTEALTALFPKN